jgi:putative sterol carrier protein
VSENEGQAPDPGQLQGLGAEQLAAMVAAVPEEQLAAGMADPANRKSVLDEIFRRMAEHVEPERAQGTDAVVHFKITGHPDGEHDHYEVVLEGGDVAVTDQPGREPRVTFSIAPVDFLKLVSGNAAGPMLFMSGKLKIEGDLMFAASMTSLFRVPRPESAAGDTPTTTSEA